MWPSCGLKLASPGLYFAHLLEISLQNGGMFLLMFVTYVSRKCCTWQINRMLLHIPSAYMAWQCPSLYQRSLNNKKCHHGDSCEILAPCYSPRHCERTFETSRLSEMCNLPRTKKRIPSLHLYAGETTATHHDYLVVYIQAKVSAVGSGIGQGSKQFRKIININ